MPKKIPLESKGEPKNVVYPTRDGVAVIEKKATITEATNKHELDDLIKSLFWYAKHYLELDPDGNVIDDNIRYISEVTKLINLSMRTHTETPEEPIKVEGEISRMESIRRLSEGSEAVIIAGIMAKNMQSFIDKGLMDEAGSVLDSEGLSEEIHRLRIQ